MRQNDTCISSDERFCIRKGSKILCCDYWQFMWSKNVVGFTRSLNIFSEISTNFCFLKLSKILEIFQNSWNFPKFLKFWTQNLPVLSSAKLFNSCILLTPLFSDWLIYSFYYFTCKEWEFKIFQIYVIVPDSCYY